MFEHMEKLHKPTGMSNASLEAAVPYPAEATEFSARWVDA